VYRKAAWFKTAHLPRQGDAGGAFKGAKKRRARRARDKNGPGSRAGPPRSFEGTGRGGNCMANAALVRQARVRPGIECQGAADSPAHAFLQGERLLAATGRDGIEEAAGEASRMPRPGANEGVFLPVRLGLGSVVGAIRPLGDANPRPWRRSLGGRFDASPHKGGRTLVFSRDPGERTLGDGEAAGAIRSAAGLPPRHKFCPRMRPSQAACGQPKSIRFNARHGTAGASAPQESEGPYGLVPGFPAREPGASAR